MGLIIVLLVILLAWVVFKTLLAVVLALLAVVLALLACALVLWIVRNAGGLRL